MSPTQVSVAADRPHGVSVDVGATTHALDGSASHASAWRGRNALRGHAPGFPLASFRPHPGARASLERRAGRLLRLVREKELYRSCGFVRLGDYVIEQLGISYRSAQEMMRVDEALEELPLVGEALEAGEISAGHARLLTRVAEAGSEVYWVGLARRTGVKALARVVAERRKQNGELAPDARLADDRTAGGASSAGSAQGANQDAGEEPDLQRLQLVVPAWIAGFWRDSIGLVRRLVGSHLPPGACFEMVLAEVADSVANGVDHTALAPERTAVNGGAGDGAGAEAADSSGGTAVSGHPGLRLVMDRNVGAAAEGHARPLAGEQPTGNAVAADDGTSRVVGQPDTGAPEAGSSVEAEPETEAGLVDEGDRDRVSRTEDTTRADSPATPHARAVDLELQALFAERQRQDALLGDHLRLVALDRGYRDHGCATLEEYASERFGLSHGSLYNLLALQRRLESLPALRRELLAGRLRTRQALLLGSVATCVTLDAWVRRAGRVTLRRLDDEVSYWRHLKESRPAVWELLEGGPLPEGIVLVPGQPPRLHAFACSVGLRSQPYAQGPTGCADLHGSAPTDGSMEEAGAPQSRVNGDLHTSASAGAECSATSKHASLTGESFLNALEQDEGTTPLPDRTCVIKLLVEPGVREMWESTLAHFRSTVRANLLEWEAFALVLREIWRVWDNKETRRQRRDNPTAERDGWRCTAPGCWSVGTGRLHEHHIVYRSRNGALTDPRNLTTLCSGHHLGLLHDGRFRCTGEAPDFLVWELGVERDREPFLVYSGEVRIGGAAAWSSSDLHGDTAERTRVVAHGRA